MLKIPDIDELKRIGLEALRKRAFPYESETEEEVFAAIEKHLKLAKVPEVTVGEEELELRTAYALSRMKASGPNASVTYNGHKYDEILSAVQKYIRRGEVDKALYAAIEADLYSLVSPTSGRIITNAKSRRTNFINRLRAIIGEDIGVANPSLLITFDRLYSTWLSLREARDAVNTMKARLALLQLVGLMAKTKKIRLVSDIKAVYFSKFGEAVAAHDPDLDYGQSSLATIAAAATTAAAAAATTTTAAATVAAAAAATAATTATAGTVEKGGEEVKKQILEKLEEGSDEAFIWVAKLLGKEEHPNGEGTRTVYKLMKEYVSGLTKIEHREKMKTVLEVSERYYYGTSRDIGFIGKRDSWIYVILPLLYLLRVREECTWSLNDTSDIIFTIDEERVSVLYERSMSGLFTHTFEDYVIDMHTKKGKTMQKDAYDFVQDGALVAFQEESLLNRDYRQIYVYGRLLKIGHSHEEARAKLLLMKYELLPEVKQLVKKRTNLKVPIILPRLPRPLLHSIEPTLPAESVVAPTLAPAPTPTHTPALTPVSVSASIKPRLPLIIPRVKKIAKVEKEEEQVTFEKETEVFSDVLRAQLTCSNNRPDVYFAFDRRMNKRVVVKGPYLDYDKDGRTFSPIFCAVWLNEIKGLLGLPNVKIEVIELVPNMWDNVPVGSRNAVLNNLKRSVEPRQKAFFLVMDDLCHGDLDPLTVKVAKKQHGSKCWPDTTEVFDIDRCPDCSIIDLVRINRLHGLLQREDLAEKLIMDMLLLYAFRYVYEVVDTCDRNFIINWRISQIYSIDEENLGEGRRKFFVGNRGLAAKDGRQNIFLQFLKVYEGHLKEKLKEWKVLINDGAGPKIYAAHINLGVLNANIDHLLTTDIGTMLF